MIWFIFGVIFALIALVIFFFAPKSYDVLESDHDAIMAGRRGEKRVVSEVHPKKWAFVPLFLALLFVLLSCFAVVGTRNVGVPTVFGKPTGDTYGAGLNFKAPWVKVTDIDATVQVEEYFGDNAIQVKIADGGEAFVGLSYRWRINPDGADEVYADYRNSDDDIQVAVKKALVSTNIKSAINEELGKYDPLDGTAITTDMTADEIANIKINVVPDYKAYNDAIQKNVEEKIAGLGDLIDIQSVTISSLKLPEATQKRINAFNTAVQDTKIALQQIATKDAQAQGNAKLAASLADPNVLVSQCFDSIAAGDFAPPAGFSCWPGNNGSVVIPSAK